MLGFVVAASGVQHSSELSRCSSMLGFVVAASGVQHSGELSRRSSMLAISILNNGPANVRGVKAKRFYASAHELLWRGADPCSHAWLPSHAA